MLKLTAPDQIHIFTISYGTRIRKISTRIRKIFFDADPELFYTKRADPKSRIGTKHETVHEKFRGMIIASSYVTVPH
jgi:hypothetical protein